MELITQTQVDIFFDPRAMVSLLPFKQNGNNIIKAVITKGKDTLSKYHIAYNGEYSSTFEYNQHGYPTKETRWYKNASEPENNSIILH